MLLDQLWLIRHKGEDADTWCTEDGDDFACAVEFDLLFKTEEIPTCLLSVYSENECDGLIEIMIEPIYDDSDFPGSRPLDYDLFAKGNQLTKEGTYCKLRKKLHFVFLKEKCKRVWVIVE